MIGRHIETVRVLTAIVTVSLVACGGGSSGAPADSAGSAGGTAGALSDAQIEHLAATYASFEKMNAQPFVTSQHQGNPMVNVYANAVAADTYRILAPTSTTTHFPAGSMLVKEMLDAKGGPPVLTVMYKLAPGYDTKHGDWWRGRLSVDGSPTSPELVGRVGFCIGCHDAASATDHAYGLP